MNPAQIAGQFFLGWDEPAPTVGHPVGFFSAVVRSPPAKL